MTHAAGYLENPVSMDNPMYRWPDKAVSASIDNVGKKGQFG
jgi:hypothetical protein